ncbi:MAG TPA: isocitrate/isopropylmalate dehydrogenase family protein [Myxococcota bacterium]|jgi:3-isopropylmalate dehydrogenase
MSVKIAVVPGDGIGKEVVAEGVKLLELVDKKLGLDLVLDHKDWGADRWVKEKVGIPKGGLDELSATTQAIYFGALGDPRIPDMAHGREILLGMRQGLDLYANFRPIKCVHDKLSPLKGKGPKEIDMLVFRENTEDMYVSVGGTFKEGTVDEVAQDISVNSRKGVERILRYAFDVAVRTGRTRVTMTDKHNAVRFGGGLWKRTFEIVKKDYPQIESEHLFVDVLAMEFVRRPEHFSVVVGNNLFGDILTDLGAALMGGLGLAASANVHPGKIGLFEPVHGSAPDIAGKGIANPMAAFSTAALLLEFACGDKGARAHKVIGEAVAACIADGPQTPDLGGTANTSAVSEFIRDRVASALQGPSA